MGRRLRTFVALRCAPDACRRLRRQTDSLAELDGAFRAAGTDDFHLTVQFLGETDEADLAAIGRALEVAAATVDPIEVVYGPLGAFPEPGRARVIWAGVREVEAPGDLERLARAVGEGLGRVGYPPEARRFHPHVTLGRLRGRPREALVRAIEAAPQRDLGGDVLSVLTLILSQPGDRGYRYIDLTNADLGRSDGP